MKIGIISDTHFGYAKFYKDSIEQGAAALLDALQKCDIIIHAGDMFDSKIPSLETLKDTLSLFENASRFKKPILAIFGNHERRLKGFSNPVEVLASSKFIKLLHCEVFPYEKNEEKINILGLSSVPDEHASLLIEKAVEQNKEQLKEGKKILVIHQSITELAPAPNSISLSFLSGLGFDLVINGHIHKRYFSKETKVLTPGSTVITSFADDELEHPRSYAIYDTEKNEVEFVDIPQRRVVLLELHLKGESYDEASAKIEQLYLQAKAQDENCLVKLKVNGELSKGAIPSLLRVPIQPDLYLKNELANSLQSELNEIKSSFDSESATKWAYEELSKRLEGKIKISDKKLTEILSSNEDTDKMLELILDEQQD